MLASASLVATPYHCDRAPQDPHLFLPRGGRADFRGRDGQYYCFLSAPRLAINIKTEDATFRLHNLHDKGGTLVVEGSFITEVRAAMWQSQPTCRLAFRQALDRVMTLIHPLRRRRCTLRHASVGGRTSSASPPFGRASSSARRMLEGQLPRAPPSNVTMTVP